MGVTVQLRIGASLSSTLFFSSYLLPLNHPPKNRPKVLLELQSIVLNLPAASTAVTLTTEHNRFKNKIKKNPTQNQVGDFRLARQPYAKCTVHW
ncbi:hypothetical protein CDAR_491871 [Caerostris darwini]|uniref:Uncharacterized protein n=1 Tax=Caerostris darwini TaxID=1538125 RepID=A0AAV4MYZ8_9ARAC|nr:hypothetical protein CDAR_491871 [Caerostris darwini]